jgi:hypothetical protein
MQGDMFCAKNDLDIEFGAFVTPRTGFGSEDRQALFDSSITVWPCASGGVNDS